MPKIKSRFSLSQEERDELKGIVAKGKHNSQKVLNALILLNYDEDAPEPRTLGEQEISNVLKVSAMKIHRVKQRFVEEGLDIALNGRERERAYERKADGDFEAHLVALSCSEPPEGQTQWSLRLLADKVMELGYIESISYETVRRGIKKNEIKPWRKVGWVIPPDHNANFVAQMEQVLDVYKRPYDVQFPVVCMDESPRQLIDEVKTPVPAKPGQQARHDYEYKRCGTCNIFMANEPLAGTRMVEVTERKTKVDWAYFVERIAFRYEDAEKIILVMDNLNTHVPGSLYEAFPPEKAKALWDRFEFIYTPKHGSWLNMAEIELNVLIGQCLNRRIAEIEVMRHEVKAWESARNGMNAGVNWQFTAEDARIKLNRLYPTLDM
ncbi:MAG: IS630 family transposase [Pseudomonadota bacterium]